MKIRSINRIIYFLFIFFLPLTGVLQLGFIPDVMRSYLFPQSSNYFMFIGLFVYICSRRFKVRKCKDLKHIFYWYGYSAIHSVILALVLYVPFGVLHNETTLRAISGNIVFYLIVALSIYYNYVMLTEYVKFNELFKIFDLQIIILLAVGYLQFFSIWNGGIFSRIYSQLAPVLHLLPIDELDRGICFFGSEPSSASILSFIVVPYLFSKLLVKGQAKFSTILELALFVPLFINSTSSSLMITNVILIVAFFALATNNERVFKVSALTAFLIGAGVAVMYGLDSFVQTTMMDKNSFLYILFGKIVDRKSMSMMARSSTIINDMRIFFKYPLTGIGNGIQGYFYNSNVPYWAKKSYEVAEWMSGKNGIVGGGGSFFCTYISSYGLIGCAAAIPIVRHYSMCMKRMKRNNAMAHRIFCMFLVMFLTSCWFSMGIRDANVSFLAALPLVYGGTRFYKNKKIDRGENK